MPLFPVEVKKIKKEFRKCEVELERLDVNLSRLKEIQRYKTTPEILKKIFHGMPLTARHVANKGKKPIMGMSVVYYVHTTYLAPPQKYQSNLTFINKYGNLHLTLSREITKIPYHIITFK